MSIFGLITVRTTSTRLPKKCLLPFGESTVLHHIIRRAVWYGLEPIVCTSTDPGDNVIEQIATEEKAKCFRGALQNKLKRWADCANLFGLDSFHTIDADDPFFDGEFSHKSFKVLNKPYDLITQPEGQPFGGLYEGCVGYSVTFADPDAISILEVDG